MKGVRRSIGKRWRKSWEIGVVTGKEVGEKEEGTSKK
jgi:hypothetical protein